MLGPRLVGRSRSVGRGCTRRRGRGRGFGLPNALMSRTDWPQPRPAWSPFHHSRRVRCVSGCRRFLSYSTNTNKLISIHQTTVEFHQQPMIARTCLWKTFSATTSIKFEYENQTFMDAKSAYRWRRDPVTDSSLTG